MKRVFTSIAIVVALSVGCLAGCSELPDYGSEVLEKLSPALEDADGLPARAFDKLGELLPAPDADGESAGVEGESGWALPSLGALFGAGELSSVDDVVLVPTDDYGCGYVFNYGGEEFIAYFDTYSWRVYDSYKITNHSDIVTICQALINVHPVYGADWESWRTAEDMAYEWEQHNLAYNALPANSHWRDDAKDVDLDPYDQGKSFSEIYESRTSE
jgi:hypothetical protein